MTTDSEESTETLPYTYADPDGAMLTVSSTGRIEITEVDDVDSEVVQAHAFVLAPKGEDAVRLVRAVLADAGETGYRVVSEEEMIAGRPVVMRIAAEAMRERILEALLSLHGPGDESAKYYADMIRALSPFPDGYEVPSAPEPLTSSETSAYQSKVKALRSDLDTLQEVVRDLGSALHDHIQTTVDHLQQEQVEALASAAEAITRRPFTVNDDH